MFARWIGTAALINFWAAGVVAAPPPEALTASGEAKVVSGNLARAREEAIESALASVTATVAEALLGEKDFRKNADLVKQRIGPNARSFMKDFKIVSASPSGDLFRVEVRAVPLKDRIHDELAKWGILFDRAKRPKLGVYPIDPEGSSRRWTQLLARRLRDLGYEVAELEPPAGKRNDFSDDRATQDVTVWGRVQLQGKDAVTANLQATLRKPYLNLGTGRDRFDLTLGAETVAGLMATLILDRLLPGWFQHVGGGRVYEVAVEGLPSFRPYQELLQMFNSGVSGFTSGRELIYARGSVTFEVVFDRPMAELAEALTRASFAGTKLKAVDASTRELRFKIR